MKKALLSFLKNSSPFFKFSLLTILFFSFFFSCSRPRNLEPVYLTQITLQDRNGFTETISTEDRLKTYQEVDFLKHQPYQKIYRLFSRNNKGETSGYFTTYFENGQPMQYLEVVNNRAYGEYKEWHENGCLKLDATVIGGEAELSFQSQSSWLFDGPSSIYSEEGSLIAFIPYSKGVLQGYSLYYYPCGALFKKAPYDKGLLCGSFETFFEDGTLLQIESFKQGKKQGLSQGFWKSGNLSFEETYELDVLKTGYYFNEEGLLISEVCNGYGFKSIFEKGLLKRQVEFRNGLAEGEVKEFLTNGQLILLFHIKNGQKEGEEIEFYDLPLKQNILQPKLSLNWHDGILRGFVKTWYPNGQIESQREMTQNKKNGLLTAWYQDGSLMLLENYDQDKLVKGEYFKKGEKKPISQIVSGTGLATLFDSEGNFLQKVNYIDGFPDDF